MHRRRAVLLMLCLLAGAPALPLGSAAWSVGGSVEPDTPADVLDGRMFLEPDTRAEGQRIYFNVIPTDRTLALEGPNPNVGALGTRVLPPAQMGMSAWLGIWKDCNRDGYIGMAETLVMEYRAELLVDDSVCPPGSRFNRFAWVSEFIYVSPRAQNHSASFPRVVWDPSAKVWGDFGRPQAEGERWFDCARPLERGAFDSTGGLLASVDCRIGHAGARTVGDTDEITGLGLAFDGEGGAARPENDCDHPLYAHVGLYGHDPCAPGEPGLLEADVQPMFTIWDCSSGPAAPAPGALDPDGGAYASIDHALARCTRPPPSSGFGETLVEPETGGARPGDPKRHADFHFDYAMPRSSVGTTPYDLGLRGPIEGAWTSTATYSAPGYMGNLFRARDLHVPGAIWFTFYAHLGDGVVRGDHILPPAGPGVYGAEPCGENDEGVYKGWDCDPSAWWNAATGGVDAPDGPRPGDIYTMRDTDCYDGALADGSGLYASPTLLSEEAPCPTTPAPARTP